MKTCTLEIKSVPTLWGVSQDHPYPDLARLAEGWRNTGGLFPSYGSPATGLATNYRAALLKPDFDPAKAAGNRTDHAGYDGNPGTLTLRGRELGEILADIEIREGNPHRPVWARWKVRNYEDPTLGEKTWLNETVLPGLLAFISAHKEGLREEAIAATLAHMHAGIRDARERLDTLETQIATATF